MTKIRTLTVGDGKYGLHFDEATGDLKARRNGENWRDLAGDKFVLTLMIEIETLRAELATRPAALDERDTCTLMGVRADGSTVNLGTAPMPPLMKARDVVRSYFGGDVDDEMSDASMALQCCREVIEHMQKAVKR